MVKVGWLLIDDKGIQIPEFSEHNGDSAKERSLKNQRQARWRERKAAGAVDHEASTPASTQPSTREEKRREEKKDSEVAVLLPLDDGSEHPVAVTAVDEFKAAYPRIDVMGELRKMRAWCIASPANRKTKRGVGKFVNGWLSRAHDEAVKNGGNVTHLQPGGGRKAL